MADADLPFAVYITELVPNIVKGLLHIEEIAQRADEGEVASAARRIVSDLLEDLNRLARQYALISEQMIIERIHATQSANRPPQHVMETHIISRPGPLGSVRVAEIAELNKIINPRGYGPFWRAQEYGTGGEGGVKSQVDRVIYGMFEPSGTAPDAAQRGRGRGNDLAFVPGGSSPGLGTIGVELEGRHFLRDGSSTAGEKWLEAILALENSYVDRVDDLLKQLRERRRGGVTIVHTIEG